MVVYFHKLLIKINFYLQLIKWITFKNFIKYLFIRIFFKKKSAVLQHFIFKSQTEPSGISLFLRASLTFLPFFIRINLYIDSANLIPYIIEWQKHIICRLCSENVGPPMQSWHQLAIKMNRILTSSFTRHYNTICSG